MADSVTIDTKPPVNPGLDYAALKVRGTELIQELSGAIWTDYNEHDPGVTTLEQLCYALTELSYRAEIPLADLLIDPALGRIDTHRQALFIPRRILPCNPVTMNDYRKLLVDRVPALGNAWLTPLPKAPGGINGLYNIAVYVPGADPCACDAQDQPGAIAEQVQQVYGAHRALCEDVASVVVLTPVKTIVGAAVTIDSTRAAEAILASILFNAGNVFAPVLSRVPLATLIAENKTAAEIFDGPLPRNGFIADEQLQPMARCITVAAVARAIARTQGVMGVRGVTAQAGSTKAGADGHLDVPADSILTLDTAPGQHGYTIRLLRKGIEVTPNPDRVQSELNRLTAAQRRTYPLSAQYAQFFGVPQGQHVDTSEYYSIQNQYPNVYGINAAGLPDDATAARHGQAKQLKGYLLPFEQLMADFFAQLSHSRELFSIDAKVAKTYFSQYLDTCVPMVEPLLKANYKRGLDRIVSASDAVSARRNRFADFLLALYGERLDASMLVTGTHQQGSAGEMTAQLLHAKLSLLQTLVDSTRNRGRGFDYQAPAAARNLAGMLIKSRIQLEMEPFPQRLRSDLLAELALQIVENDIGASIGKAISGDDETIEENFVPVAPSPDEPAGLETPFVLQGHRVTEDFLGAAARREHFRMGPLPGDGGIAVVCKAPSDRNWRFVSRFTDERQAAAAVDRLVRHAEHLSRGTRQLQIVEHVLLRAADDFDDGAEEQEAAARRHFAYSFTISAVVICSHAQARNRLYQDQVREVIRANAPAAVLVEYCFLGPLEGLIFEAIYGGWRMALRRGTPGEIAEACAQLRRFLHRHRARGDAPATG